MSRRTATLLIAMIAAALSAAAQDDTRQHLVPGTFALFTTDEMGNIYALRGDELELYDKRGAFLLRNSVKTFGRISAIDAFYSFKPMVFSRDMGQFVLLDNTLSVQGAVIDLPRSGHPQVTLVCPGVQNTFWFFDERDLELLRMDTQLRPLAKTGRLDQLLGFTPRPASMQELDSRLYVNDPERGIHVFDLFGTFVRTIPIAGARSIEVRGQRLYYLVDNGAMVYDLRSFDMDELPLPSVEGEVTGLRVELDRVYLKGAAGITIVDLPRP